MLRRAREGWTRLDALPNTERVSRLDLIFELKGSMAFNNACVRCIYDLHVMEVYGLGLWAELNSVTVIRH